LILTAAADAMLWRCFFYCESESTLIALPKEDTTRNQWLSCISNTVPEPKYSDVCSTLYGGLCPDPGREVLFWLSVCKYVYTCKGFVTDDSNVSLYRAAVLNSSPHAPCSAHFVCSSYHFRRLFYSNVSALRSGHHRIFHHDSSSKRMYMFHSKCIEVCEMWI